MTASERALWDAVGATFAERRRRADIVKLALDELLSAYATLLAGVDHDQVEVVASPFDAAADALLQNVTQNFRRGRDRSARAVNAAERRSGAPRAEYLA
jgi:hypothetical protein